MRMTTLKLSEEELKKIKLLAVEQDISMGELIRRAIREYLDKIK